MEKDTSLLDANIILFRCLACYYPEKRLEFLFTQQKESYYSPANFWQLLYDAFILVKANMELKKETKYNYDFEFEGNRIKGGFHYSYLTEIECMLIEFKKYSRNQIKVLREELQEKLNRAIAKEDYNLATSIKNESAKLHIKLKVKTEI